jgi:hypothetical protein
MSDQQTSESSQPQFSVPETYKDAGWAQNIKSHDDLWGQFANAQTLIGKRPAGIPTQDAPPEEWEKFYTAKGRPESPDKYQFESKFEGLPENVDLGEYEGKAKAFFHKLGLSPKEAQQAWSDYIGMEIEGYKGLQAKQSEQKAALDKEFDELTAKLWGDKYKDVEAKSLETIKAAVPDDLKDAIPYIAENPKALAATIKLVEHADAQAAQLRNELAEVKKKYGVEDKLNSGSQTGSTSKDDVVKALTEANMKVRGLDPFSPERKQTMEKIEELRGQLARMSK